MKNLKQVIICSSLMVFFSCQKESIDTETDIPETIAPSNLLDEDFTTDLEMYKNSKIIFENGEYSIEQVLTDPVLFDSYVNADSQFFHEDTVKGISNLYVSTKDSESAEAMVAEIESNIEESSRSQKTNNSLSYDFKLDLYKHVNYTGGTYKWYRSGVAGSSDNNKVRRNINVPGWITNKASSLRWTRVLGSGLESGNLRIYRNDNLSGTNSTITVPKNIANLSYNAVGNDHIESVAFLVTAK